eukprot:CAMPEP_0113503318 /NCGR_PEP_ID=MMETSP0014_2-20120614/34078_1 /TAXON_ID=2857 /ORGANISM="Nitzschia sp." /LENGTH=32 /DNA_ID=CAMNT_0000398273 /DNA_START=131 /DNA_END=225 /DNA_ORIENTATION=- /assembly_acc=CAM_ASM_000159
MSTNEENKKTFTPFKCPSLAQTHMQGPMINGS